MAQFLLVLVVALTVGAVVFGVSVLVTGADQGLGAAEPDGRAVPLPGTRPLVEEDLQRIRFDVAVRGYRMAQVDQAMRRAAYDIGYKDELIGVLEAEVEALRSGRTADADVLRRARQAALEVANEAAEPQVAESEVAESQVAEPGMTEPGMATSDTAKPDTAAANVAAAGAMAAPTLAEAAEAMPERAAAVTPPGDAPDRPDVAMPAPEVPAEAVAAEAAEPVVAEEPEREPESPAEPVETRAEAPAVSEAPAAAGAPSEADEEAARLDGDSDGPQARKNGGRPAGERVPDVRDDVASAEETGAPAAGGR